MRLNPQLVLFGVMLPPDVWKVLSSTKSPALRKTSNVPAPTHETVDVVNA
jgi:hypothetical protein